MCNSSTSRSITDQQADSHQAIAWSISFRYYLPPPSRRHHLPGSHILKLLGISPMYSLHEEIIKISLASPYIHCRRVLNHLMPVYSDLLTFGYLRASRKEMSILMDQYDLTIVHDKTPPHWLVNNPLAQPWLMSLSVRSEVYVRTYVHDYIINL